MPNARIFRSRWAALLWAGGILWTAYDVADSAPAPKSAHAAAATDATGEQVNQADLAVLANSMMSGG